MKHITRILIFALLASTGIKGQELYTNIQNDLQQTINRIVGQSGIPGMTLAIAFDDKNMINVAAGYNDVENKTMLQPDTRMLSGSVGKMLVSAIVLKLHEQNKIDLDAKASIYLDSYIWFAELPNASDITVRNLLNHTSGLPRYIFQPEFLKDIELNPLKSRSPADCLTYVLNKLAIHPCGKGWAYSDTNYLLLGLIIENITGSTYYEVLQNELLVPMNLALTEPSVNRKLTGLAQGYIGSQNYFHLPKKVIVDDLLAINPAFEWTGGGVITNVKDLVSFIQALHNGNYLNDQSKEMLTQPVNMATGEPFDQGYGLGSFVWSKRNDTRYGHSGFFPGYLSHVEYSAKRQYAIAIQLNTDEGYPMLQQFVYEIEEVISKHLDKIDEGKILDNFKKQENCWNAHNIECYMEAYAKNLPIQTASRGGLTFGYDNIISDYKKYFPKDKMGSLFFDRFNMRRLADDIYFVTGQFNLKFSDREQLSKGWFSVTAKKINGDWFLITDHSS